jgi:Nuclease-related domain
MHVAVSSGHDPAARRAGQHARAIVLRLRMRTLITLGALAVATGVLGKLFGLHDPLFVGSEIALLAMMFAISRFVLPLLDRHDRGATGEEQVGQMLDELAGRGWRVIHDATLGNGNVDHILIGPPGVFTVETKSHPGPVKVNRIHGATLNQAHAQQRSIERVTGERVEPLIVFSRAWVDRPLMRRKGVRVVPARMLIGFLAKRPTRFTSEEIEKAHRRVAAALADARSARGLNGRRLILR